MFLADDHAIVRSGLRGYLELTDDLTLVGEAVSGRDALDRLAALAVRRRRCRMWC